MSSKARFINSTEAIRYVVLVRDFGETAIAREKKDVPSDDYSSGFY